MPSVQVEYFALFREHAGRSREEISTDAATVGELFAELSARYDFPSIGVVKAAVNDEFRDWNAAISDGDLIVFIPPVAGG